MASLCGSYDDLVDYLRGGHLIHLTKICLRRMHWMSQFLHPMVLTDPAEPVLEVNVRVFLAGFMVAYFPSNVFDGMGALERKLLAVARPMVETFEKMCVGMAGGAESARNFRDLPAELTREFPTMMREYMKAFKVWKRRDDEMRVGRVKCGLLSLTFAQRNLPPGEPADSSVRREFVVQIGRLRAKLVQVSPNGHEVLRQFDEELETTLLDMQEGRQELSDEECGKGMPLVMFQKRMTNEDLAHELLLDPMFQLDKQYGSSTDVTPSMRRVRNAAQTFFWASLEGDLKLSPPCHVRSLRIMEEVKDGLYEMYSRVHGQAGAIEETFDVEFLRHQVEHGVFDWDGCKRLVHAAVGIMQRNQASGWGDEISAGWRDVRAAMNGVSTWDEGAATVFCKAMRFMLDAVNRLRIDTANARLRLMTPMICSHGLEYERGHFRMKLAGGLLTLERATAQAWIRKTLSMRPEEVDMSGLARGCGSAIGAAIDVALMEIVAGSEAGGGSSNKLLLHADCPEMLLLDEVRLRGLQAEFCFLVTAATMLVRTSHLLGPAGGNQASAAAIVTEMGKALAEEPSRARLLDKVVSRLLELPSVVSDLDDGMKESLRLALMSSTVPRDCVRKVMAHRIRIIWLKIMRQGGGMPADVTLASAVQPLTGLIVRGALKGGKVANLSKAVHAEHYSQIFTAEARNLTAGVVANVRTEAGGTV